MADVVDPPTRSRMMAGIRGANTKPELLLRRRLHAAGLRYRLHVADLPGRPDIVFPSRRAVVFVHGCFWHRHPGCHWCTTPASNRDFWTIKFNANMDRDQQHIAKLIALGWRVAVIWECAFRDGKIESVALALRKWLDGVDAFFETDLVRRR
ncbi:very short patch repair endonuclease [Nitrosovibrio sp. Nv6]|uniref:very short patch repair endonuclease n=1 Tax=Nitrosovibrio sp. Nv6 TaxID=1855340 RepID=UPI0015A5F79F|nr:very short patch repair endonuclease [Nitrosovibrio sp. Nv6]